MLPAGVKRHRFTAEEYHGMVEVGLLREGDRVELIVGEIVEMSPVGWLHARCVNRLAKALVRLVGDRYEVNVQNPVALGEGDEPQPDLALVREDPSRRRLPVPGAPGEVALIAEVSDATLPYDKNIKLPLYAGVGTPEVGIVDFQGRGSRSTGAKLCGGHSVQDEEPKYGFSVTGFVEGDRVVRNAGARVGDALVLTKPLGFGILTTALKRDLVPEPEVEDAVEEASRLNKGARDAMRGVSPSAATDVTGYGLLGHLSEMVDASGVGALVRRGEVPVWERAVPLANDGIYPGGLKSNREYLEGRITADGVGENDLLPLYDPQTSGGLLVAVPAEEAQGFVAALEANGASGAVIGEVVSGRGVRVMP